MVLNTPLLEKVSNTNMSNDDVAKVITHIFYAITVHCINATINHQITMGSFVAFFCVCVCVCAFEDVFAKNVGFYTTRV